VTNVIGPSGSIPKITSAVNGRAEIRVVSCHLQVPLMSIGWTTADVTTTPEPAKDGPADWGVDAVGDVNDASEHAPSRKIVSAGAVMLGTCASFDVSMRDASFGVHCELSAVKMCLNAESAMPKPQDKAIDHECAIGSGKLS
jgi:hypothetical protein